MKLRLKSVLGSGSGLWRTLGLIFALAAVSAQSPLPKAGPSAAELIDALHKAPSEQAAAVIEDQLRHRWHDAASPAIKLLLSRGARELKEDAAGDAVDSFDAALDLDPSLAEAWRGRSQARLRIGDTDGAVRDIEEALRREPNSFAAWQDLSHVAEARGDWHGALAAWEKVLEIDPRSPGGQNRLRELRRHALGDNA